MGGVAGVVPEDGNSIDAGRDAPQIALEFHDVSNRQGGHLLLLGLLREGKVDVGVAKDEMGRAVGCACAGRGRSSGGGCFR